MRHTAGMSEPDTFPHVAPYPLQPAPGGEPFTLQRLAPAKRRRTGLRIALAAAALVVLAGAALMYLALRGGSFTMTGTLILQAGQGCREPGYGDISDGGQVTVHDETSAVIAIGTLGVGEVDIHQHSCVWDFRVENVPGGKRFYGIEIGRRPVLRFSEAQAREKLKLTLG